MRFLNPAPLAPYEEAITDSPPEDFVEIDGQSVYARDVGSGPVIVLLHGFASTTHSFREIFAALSGDFRLIGIDLNGFGKTQRPREATAYAIVEQAALIVEVLSRKKIDRAVFIGHSYGAAVTAILCETYPGFVSRAVLICPPSEFAQKPPWYLRNVLGMRVAYFMIRALLSNPQKFKEVSGRAVYVEGVLTDELADLYRRSMLVEGFKQACFGYGKAFATGAADFIHYDAISQPVLVIAGERDAVVSVQSCRVVAEKISSSRLIVLPECGHCPPEERPEEVVTLLRAFFTE